MPDNIVKILDVKINALSKAEVLERIKNLLLSESDEQCQLVTTNPEFIISAQTDEEFKNIINNSWLSVADGYGIRLAAKYLDLIKDKKNTHYLPTGDLPKGDSLLITHPFFIGLKIAWWGMLKKDDKLDIIKETITGTDLVPEICRILSVIPMKIGIQKKIFLLGGYGDVPQLTADKLQTMAVETHCNASLQIAHASFELPNIIEKINLFQPSVLFVALNHPRAQKWIDENLSKMPSVKLAIGVGGAFDYLAGKIKRAPQNWQGSFEWLYRLITQPKRWKRIWNASVKFPWLVFRNTI